MGITAVTGVVLALGAVFSAILAAAYWTAVLFGLPPEPYSGIFMIVYVVLAIGTFGGVISCLEERS